jgi:carbonic anhydrase
MRASHLLPPLLALLLLQGPAARAQDDAQLQQRLADKLKLSDPALKPRKTVNVSPGSSGASAPAKAKAPAKAASKPAGPWDYAGDASPQHWAELAPENRLCGLGTRQSPIDIRDTIKVDLEKIQFDYRASGFAVADTGHTIEVKVASGNTLQVMGRSFELKSFHFHRPSEERVMGRQYDMVMHLVHKDPDGNTAIVAVLIERGPDNKPQAAVQQVWNNLPLERSMPQTAADQLDPMQLLPTDRRYFTFMGSLTTPPCSENVLWIVLKQPVQLTSNQIGIFARLYPMNARPLQSASGRMIKESQ